MQVETWKLIASSIACILAASALEKSGVLPPCFETISEMVMSPACNSSSWISYRIFPLEEQSQTLMHVFLQTTSERPKGQRRLWLLWPLWLPRSSSTTVLRKSVTLCWNCQGLQSSEAKKNAVLHGNHWPQTNSAEVMKDRQSINLMLCTLLDRRLLLLHCECKFLPSCIRTVFLADFTPRHALY